MLTEDGPSYANWDQDATAIDERYATQDPAQVAAELRTPRPTQLADRYDTRARRRLVAHRQPQRRIHASRSTPSRATSCTIWSTTSTTSPRAGRRSAPVASRHCVRTAKSARPLEGIRVVESSLLEPASLGALLADLGADVVKVEPPGEGDYVRRMAWPIIDGISILHWHCNRGQAQPRRSTCARTTPSSSTSTSSSGADVVIEGMRPGALARRGITCERMQELNPAIVFVTISGFGTTGPYKDLPSHGIAFDTWAAVAPVERDDDGFTYLGDHVSGRHQDGARVGRARRRVARCCAPSSPGQGARLDVAQTDAAAAVNWLKIEGYRAYERPEDEVTGNASDNYERRERRASPA